MLEEVKDENRISVINEKNAQIEKLTGDVAYMKNRAGTAENKYLLLHRRFELLSEIHADIIDKLVDK